MNLPCNYSASNWGYRITGLLQKFSWNMHFDMMQNVQILSKSGPKYASFMQHTHAYACIHMHMHAYGTYTAYFCRLMCRIKCKSYLVDFDVAENVELLIAIDYAKYVDTQICTCFCMCKPVNAIICRKICNIWSTISDVWCSHCNKLHI